jgi:hypothetical protein
MPYVRYQTERQSSFATVGQGDAPRKNFSGMVSALTYTDLHDKPVDRGMFEFEMR